MVKVSIARNFDTHSIGILTFYIQIKPNLNRMQGRLHIIFALLHLGYFLDLNITKKFRSMIVHTNNI